MYTNKDLFNILKCNIIFKHNIKMLINMFK